MSERVEPEPERREGPHWWQTLPGALTAIAGLITAVTGLIVAVNQLGVFSGEEDEPASVAATSTPRGGTTTAGSGSASGTGAYTVTFPQGTKATIGTAVYEITGTNVERQNPGELALTLAVSMTNNGLYDANFWTRSFRLRVDGEARAPTNDLNEVVPGRSSDEGEVVFAVPETAGDLTLLVGDTDTVELPLVLRPA